MTTNVRPSPRLPKPPSGVGTWGYDITRAIDQLYRELAYREITSHISFAFADRPTSQGNKVFGFATDTDQLFYDEDGQWWEIGLVPSYATGFVALQASSPGTQQTGHFNISGTGLVGSLTASSTVTAELLVADSAANVDAQIRWIGDDTWSAGYDDSLDSFSISNSSILGTNQYLRIDTNGNFVPGIASLTDTATNGFLYVPLTVSAPPTGVPTAFSGHVGFTVGDDNLLYWYSNGAWRSSSSVSVPASAGVVYTDGVSLLTDAGALTWTAATNRLLVSDNSGQSANSDLSVEKSSAGSAVSIRVRNANNSAGSDAYLMAQVASTGAPDPYLWLFANATGWVFGLDQSDSLKLKWVWGDTIGAGTPAAGTVMSLTRSGTPVLSMLGNSSSALFDVTLNSAGAVAAATRYTFSGGTAFTVGIIGSTGNFHITASTTGVTSGLVTVTPTGDVSFSAASAPTYDVDLVDSKTGDQVIATRNTRNSSGTDDAYFYAESGGTSAGDPGLLMRIGTSGNGGYLILDNSSGDDITMGLGVTFGSSAVFIAKQTTGCLAFPLQYRAYVTNSADFTIGTAANTTLTWNTETEDVGGLHSTSSNTGRMTIPSDGAGWYVASGRVAWDSNTTGFRMVQIVKNGVTVLAGNQHPASSAGLGAGSEYLESAGSVTWIGPLAASDYVELWVYQNSGGNRTVDKDFAHFAIHKLS